MIGNPDIFIPLEKGWNEQIKENALDKLEVFFPHNNDLKELKLNYVSRSLSPYIIGNA